MNLTMINIGLILIPKVQKEINIGLKATKIIEEKNRIENY